MFVAVRDNWFYKLSDTAINFHCGQNNVAVNNMIHHTTGKRVFGTCNKAVGPGGIPRQVRKLLLMLTPDTKCSSKCWS